jgi:chaperonin GroEL
MIVNKIKGVLKIAVVKSPSFGDNRKSIMEDIAIVTKGQFVTEEAGINLAKNGEKPETIESTLGVAKTVIITKDDTTILHGNGDK